MLKPFSFPKSIRLTQYQSIQNLFQSGKKKVIYPLVFQYLKNEETKIIITISKKFGNSVKRNRLKRKIKEVLRVSVLMELKIACAVGVLIGKSTKQKEISFYSIKSAVEEFIFFQKIS